MIRLIKLISLRFLSDIIIVSFMLVSNTTLNVCAGVPREISPTKPNCNLLEEEQLLNYYHKQLLISLKLN